jgi:hypothetical protein
VKRGGAALVAFVGAWLCLFCAIARAQHAPQLRIQLDADTVGVGDVVHVRVSASSSEAMPDDARLGATPGFSVRGQQAFPQTSFVSMNGVQSTTYTLQVTWTLVAERPGSFHIGGPSVTVGGVRYPSRPVTITVVGAGKAPPRAPQQPQMPPGMQNPFNMSPFDPWKGFLQQFDQMDRGAPPEEQQVPIDPKLSQVQPRGAVYFLHATVDKTSAAVGEQVLFTIYAYRDAEAGRFQADQDAGREPDVPDFVKHPLVSDDKLGQAVGYASIGGHIWEVTLALRWALFPLHSGDLGIGPMHMGILRPASAAGPRTSESIVVHVAEPPVAGRPPGYSVGDVGRYSLSAEVKPREVEEGGAVGVHIELLGSGNVPSAITTPARAGIEWLPAETHDDVGPKGQDDFGGKRTFDFVVRVHRPGNVDLGEMALPYWNPVERRYDIARAPLGAVHVTPLAAAATGGEDAPAEVLPGMPPPRDALARTVGPRSHWDDSAAFWIAGIGAWPLAFGVAVAGRAVGRRAKGAWERRRTSPVAELRERLAEATTACDKADARTVDAAIARALEAASVAHAGVSIRGAVGSEVADRLAQAGVARATAESVADLLRECEAARFAPDEADIAQARGRWDRARGAIRGMEAGA